VEAVLLELGALREAAVVGVPATGVRASLGELVKAVLVAGDPDITKTDVLRHCHRRLASFKIPHIVEFRDALPRNPAGKVRKDELT
jgi:acyl-CoA synthetase (AMP-forming)/AMP-acid ligase II